MAEANSMTAREAASNVMAAEHADVLRESVAVMVKQIMEAEVASSPAPSFTKGHRIAAQRSATAIAAALGYACRRDRAADPAPARGQLPAELP